MPESEPEKVWSKEALQKGLRDAIIKEITSRSFTGMWKLAVRLRDGNAPVVRRVDEGAAPGTDVVVYSVESKTYGFINNIVVVENVVRAGRTVVDSTLLAVTPGGRFYLTTKTTWHLDESKVKSKRKIPNWALITTFVTLFLIPGFNFLFLLFREDRTTGPAVVTVWNEPMTWRETVSITSAAQLKALRAQVADYVSRGSSITL